MEIVNTEQAAAWDGHEGDVWTEQADRYDRAGGRILDHFVAADLIRPADRVVDIGCGTGRVTRLVAGTAVDGSVLGIDLSSRMLELARKRTADDGLTNVTFVQGDAQVFPFEANDFDVAISSFGAMFFNDPVAAFANIARGVCPGGRLAVLAWRTLPENDWLMELRAALAVGRELPMPPPDAPTPFSLADPARVQDIFGRAGFGAVECTPIDEPMMLGTDLTDAMDYAQTMGIVEGLTDGLEPEARERAMANLRELFALHETADGVLLKSAAWLITARSLKEG
ncbi:MAG: methyltransferase domain-containing protein [Actinobacteria bacterium]|nr:methyltransferase domain-containing protein [Actinomycetota bacterium]MBV8958937.1 methyltransferase domain-containing protein [Actinomycetota bacterium]MBV9665989.1 methyltransferase domain-containing protein [Actinomycetota bacterium]